MTDATHSPLTPYLRDYWRKRLPHSRTSKMDISPAPDVPIIFGLAAAPERRIRAIHIIETVAEFAKITVAEMKGPRRARYACVPRQAAMYLAYAHCKHMSLPALGRIMGGRDHSTVFHARNKVQADLDAGGEIFGAIVAHVERELGVG